MDTFMNAIAKGLSIGGLTLAMQTALDILTHNSDIGYLEWRVRSLEKQLNEQTGGKDKDECTRETDES